MDVNDAYVVSKVAVNRLLRNFKFLPSHIDREDLVQQGVMSYLAAYSKRTDPDLDSWDKMKWVIVLDDLKDYVRQNQKSWANSSKQVSLDSIPNGYPVSMNPDPAESLMWGELLSKLSSKHRDLLMLLYYEGCTQAEVARMRGVSEQAVGQEKQKALERLMQHVK